MGKSANSDPPSKAKQGKMTAAGIIKADNEQKLRIKRAEQLKKVKELLSTGKTISAIAKQVQAPRQTVSTWANKINKGQRINPEGRPDMASRVMRYLGSHFSTRQTFQELRVSIRNKVGDVSDSVIYRALKFLKLKPKVKRTKKLGKRIEEDNIKENKETQQVEEESDPMKELKLQEEKEDILFGPGSYYFNN